MAGRNSELYERGMRVRREVLGDAYVDRATNPSPFTADFQRLVTEYCWGECWADDRLTRRTRSVLNLGMTAALGRMEEFQLHFRGALNNGLTEEELSVILLQIAVYCGIPAGVACFRSAQEVLGERAGDGAGESNGSTDAGRLRLDTDSD
ncbi:MAG TPA: carboxymuconolactone decarboxylase family protein [Solirubrobacteraceae bacterium]|nr:carboxymuconolactone decarboxylase family protein [Solirubrobacteraceae bacterium]